MTKRLRKRVSLKAIIIINFFFFLLLHVVKFLDRAKVVWRGNGVFCRGSSTLGSSNAGHPSQETFSALVQWHLHIVQRSAVEREKCKLVSLKSSVWCGGANWSGWLPALKGETLADVKCLCTTSSGHSLTISIQCFPNQPHFNWNIKNTCVGAWAVVFWVGICNRFDTDYLQYNPPCPIAVWCNAEQWT